jgi:hypothetical protein
VENSGGQRGLGTMTALTDCCSKVYQDAIAHAGIHANDIDTSTVIICHKQLKTV